MAIYGTLGESSIGALDESISGTAVDVFVYDTSQDSDGGAWRKRTQHTSWYSETLNTSTRGSRKELPVWQLLLNLVKLLSMMVMTQICQCGWSLHRLVVNMEQF